MSATVASADDRRSPWLAVVLLSLGYHSLHPRQILVECAAREAVTIYRDMAAIEPDRWPFTS
jgi:hypothetical protein